MKDKKLIRNFFIGGCIGKTLMEISGIFANIITSDNVMEALSQFKSLIIIFIIGGIVYNIAVLSIKHIEKKDMTSKQRQQLLKNQMYITAGAVFIFSICLILYTIKGNYIGVILALSFATVFSFWGYSFLISYITLKNSMAMITKKDYKIYMHENEIEDEDEDASTNNE